MCRNRVRQEDEMARTPTSRREFFRLVAGTSTALAGVWTAAVTQAQPLRPTPSCPDAPQPTARQTEGPYFKPESPRRASLLEPGISGVKIVVAGVVLSTNCQHVPRALIDVWHADGGGAYNHAAHRLRPHQPPDDRGRYRHKRTGPGKCRGGPRHFHVKVQAANRPLLTTQLYFPGEAGNGRDPILQRDLVMRVQDAADGKIASFDFVLRS